jgi:thioredoxin 1
MTETNGRVKNVTDDSFNDAVADGVSVVDFWAPWCYPCRIQGPILEKVAGQVGDKFNVYKMNVDENSETAMKHGVTGIPTLLLFKNGQVMKEFVGVQGENVLISQLESLA